jgi:2-phosphosulfolactate phosphatase
MGWLRSGAVRVHVAFTPAETVSADVGVVVDVLRATSTVAQALAGGYARVLSCSEIDEAKALAEAEGGLLAGERKCVRIPGFDRGNSPREFLDGGGETVILTTTNGTRALVAAAASCRLVLAGSLINLEAVSQAARGAGGDVAIVCAGVLGELALDDVYAAGRIAELLGGELTDGAAAAIRIARSFPTAEEGLSSSQSARNLVAAGLDDDIAWCARESVLDVVPRVAGTRGTAVELVA